MKGICIKLGFNPQKNISLLQDGRSFFVYSSNMAAVTSYEHILLLMSETVTFYRLFPEDENTELSIVFAISPRNVGLFLQSSRDHTKITDKHGKMRTRSETKVFPSWGLLHFFVVFFFSLLLASIQFP